MDKGYGTWIAERRSRIVERIGRAAEASGRDAREVRLLAVSKTVGVNEVIAAIGAGYTHFAENRPQELVRKMAALSEEPDVPSAAFDMIGNLQKNKINAVLGRAGLIHSISSLHLAEAVSSRATARIEAGSLPAAQPVLIEVNVSGEASKSGFAPDELLGALDTLRELPGLELRGLMAMAPRGSGDIARRTFGGLRELRDKIRAERGLALPELSCGMSEDFEAAVAEGSTMVRLGRVAFDPSFELE